MAKKTDFVNFLALGAGSVGSGFISKKVPIENAMVKNGISIGLGYFLTTQKDEKAKFLGYGMISGGLRDMANNFGIGDEALADDGVDDEALAEEIAEEIAQEMEQEVEEEMTM
jgi:hypothetical protein